MFTTDVFVVFSFGFVEVGAVYRVQCNLSEPPSWLMICYRVTPQALL